MGYIQMSRNVESIFGAVVTAPHQIPFTYTATGGETFISLPFYPVTGFITINGGVQVPVDNYEIDGNTINLGRELEAGDVVYCLFDKILSPEDYKNGIRIYKFQAVGNEASFTPDFTSYGVQALYVDGKFQVPGVNYNYDKTTGVVTFLTGSPTAGVWVVAEMSVNQNYPALSEPGGAGMIGSSSGNTVQEELDTLSSGIADIESSIDLGFASRYARLTTVAEVATGKFPVGTELCLTDREYAHFKVTAGTTVNGMDLLNAGTNKVATLQIRPEYTIKCIGAKQDNLSVDETAYVQRWIQIFKGVIKFGNCTVGNLDFKGNFVRQIKLTGDVKSAVLTSVVWWDLASTDMRCEMVDIDLGSYTVDCDFKNQTVRTRWIMTDYNSRIIVHDGKVINMYDRGIGGGLSTYKLLDVYNMDFAEGSLHNGSIDPALAESCHFIGVFPGERTRIRFCSFKQLTDPVGMQNRNPGGVFLSGGNPAKEIEVSDCNFDNLGNLIGGNLVSPLDVYSHARSVTFARNRFTRSRYNAFRSTNAERTVVENNEVLQDVPIYYDGGAAYNDAACLVVGIVPRGYAINSVDNYVYDVRNNVFKVLAAAGNCRGITAASDSTDSVVSMVRLINNTYIGETTNTLQAVLIDKVLNFEVRDSYVKGFSQGYRIQRTDGAAAIAAGKGFSGKSVGVISTKSISTAESGIYCRLECNNLALSIKEMDLYNCPTPFTVRNIASLRVDGNILGATSSGDAQGNAAFWHTNNAVPFASDPTSYTTNTYYRLLNNIGRTDRISA